MHGKYRLHLVHHRTPLTLRLDPVDVSTLTDFSDHYVSGITSCGYSGALNERNFLSLRRPHDRQSQAKLVEFWWIDQGIALPSWRIRVPYRGHESLRIERALRNDLTRLLFEYRPHFKEDGVFVHSVPRTPL